MQLTFKKYRTIDLVLFAVLLCIFETVCVVVANKWIDAGLFTVSITYAILAIVYMRWNAFGIIHAILGGFVYARVYRLCGSDVGVKEYAMYIVGNLFTAISLVLFKIIGKQKIRDNIFLSLLFAIIVYILAHVGRATVAVIYQKGFLLLSFISSDVVSLLFTCLAVFITRRLDGMFEDQKTYLFRQERERKEQNSDGYEGRPIEPKNKK